MPGRQRYLERLKVMRRTLSNELMDIINEFGPKLYDDFDKACRFPRSYRSFLTIILIQNRVLFPSSSVPMSSGKPGLWQRDSGAAATETQENLLAHPMVRIHERTQMRAPFLTSHRIGSMSVYSDGAVAQSVGRVHGLVPYLGVEMPAVLHRQKSQMMRTQGITTTFSAYCAQMMGMSLPIMWDYEASMALTQTCRSSRWLGFKGSRPADLCGRQGRQPRVAYTDESGG
jgi:hypothetical protein